RDAPPPKDDIPIRTPSERSSFLVEWLASRGARLARKTDIVTTGCPQVRINTGGARLAASSGWIAQMFRALPAAASLLIASMASAAPGGDTLPALDASVLPATARVRPATAGDDPHPVEARLWLDSAVVEPGGVVRVGVQLVQDPHW